MKTNAPKCANPKINTCPECGGSGQALLTNDHPNSPYARLYLDTCPDCNGVGGFPDEEYLCSEPTCPECPGVRESIETGYREQLADYWQGKFTCAR